MRARNCIFHDNSAVLCGQPLAIVAGVVFAVNTYLTVKRAYSGGTIRKAAGGAFTFLILSTLAIIVNISKVPLDAYAIPVGSFITGVIIPFYSGYTS